MTHLVPSDNQSGDASLQGRGRLQELVLTEEKSKPPPPGAPQAHTGPGKPAFAPRRPSGVGEGGRKRPGALWRQQEPGSRRGLEGGGLLSGLGGAKRVCGEDQQLRDGDRTS